MTARDLPPVDQNGVANGVPLAIAASGQRRTRPALGSTGYTAFYGNAAALVGPN